VDGQRTRRLSPRWLALEGSSRVIVLGAARHKGALWIDLYNTSVRKAAVKVGGTAVDGRRLGLADMLSRPCAAIRNGTAEMGPEAFARVVARRRRGTAPHTPEA
jgi:hypothetical protein